MNKKRIINKKGISLVVAMALSVFLLLITGGFLSMSILQQNDTGEELNTRQAYVSAKSTLDLAKDWLQNGKLDDIFPDFGTDGYYVFYQVTEGEEIFSAELADLNGDGVIDEKDVKKFFKDNSSCIQYGDAYIKISVDDSGNSTLSSFSSVGDYNSGKENFGDLSVDFVVSTEALEEDANGVVKDAVVPEEDYGSSNTQIKRIPIPGSANRFMMVGQQTNFTLLKSYSDNSGQTYRTIADSNIQNGTRVWRPNLNSEDKTNKSNYTVDSHFPLVFTDPLQYDTDENRAVFKAYNEGIYLLGSFNLKNNKDYGNIDTNVAMFTNNVVYGTQFHCRFLVLGNNIAARNSDSLHVFSYDNAITYKNKTGVVLYIPKTIYSYVGSTQKKEFEPGYYLLETNLTLDGKKYASLFNEPSLTSIDTSNIDALPADIREIINSNLYSSLVTISGQTATVNNVQSAGDQNKAYPDIAKIQITYDNGKFSEDKKVFNSNSGATRTGLTGNDGDNTKFYSKWDTTSIYCAPNEMPDSGTRYDLYCGGSFNFLWYSINDMKVKSNSKIYLSSSNNVLTIGPDCGESVQKVTTDSGYYFESNHNGTGTTASNVMKASDSDSSFYVCPSPYEKNSTTIKLTVMNNFTVSYSEKEYTIYKGEYEIPQYEGDIQNWTDSHGMDLFSDKAKAYFSRYSEIDDDTGESPDGKVTVIKTTITIEDLSKKAIKAWEDPCNWLDSGKVVKPGVPADLRRTDEQIYDYFVDLDVASGTLSGDYKATSIDAIFSNDTRFTNATLYARQLKITASKLSGDGLFFNTFDLNAEAEARVTTEAAKIECYATFKSNEPGSVAQKGQLIHFVKPDGATNTSLVLCDAHGNPTGKTIKYGTYFIPITSSNINILDPDSWYGSQKYYLVKKDGTTEYKKFSTNEYKYNFTFDESGYF